jgi:tRNA(His) 5'-end guanylyltransferase
MSEDLNEQFAAFELFGDEKLMRGFIRVARLCLVDPEKVLGSEELGFAQPFDPELGKMMVKTASHLLGVIGEVVFGVASCREISVLLAGIEEEGNLADGRQLVCQLSAAASSKLTLLMDQPQSFETHLYEFPSADIARTYFYWRQKANDAFALDRYVGYALLSDGKGAEQVHELLSGFAPEEKVEILEQHDMAFESVPSWQRYGVGLYWQAGVDDAEPSLMLDTNLPADKAAFDEYLSQFL